MDKDVFVFKVKYGDIFRRFTVDQTYFKKPNITFSRLKDIIRRAFEIPTTSKLAIVYTDKDNDEVTMVNDEDIEDACVYQGLDPVRVTVRAQALPRSAPDGRPRESIMAGDGPPSWAVDIILKLDQLLLAVNKQPVEPGVESVITKSTMIEHHVLQGVDASPSDVSTVELSANLDVLPAEEWTDIAQSGYDSEFLRRIMILRQRGERPNDELSD